MQFFSTQAAGLARPVAPAARPLIGILEGEGVGPQLTRLCVELLETLTAQNGRGYDLRIGGAIGLEALRSQGSVLPQAVCDFCGDVFAAGGAILAGPGGGRFVYDLRRRFALFVKLNPILSFPEMAAEARLRRRDESPLDILVVRENLGGLYQGRSDSTQGEQGLRVEHRFEACEADVTRVTDAAARLAAARRGHLTVVAKDAGLPVLSRLWFDCGRRSAASQGVALRTLDIDFAGYQFLAAPEEFDVIAVPNCFGDIIADLGGLLCGSRGMTFGGSFSTDGAAVYQTNHGAAYDLAGRDSANPIGQILSLAMLLRESFDRADEAMALVTAVRRTLAQGWRTADILAPGCNPAGTSDFARRVIDNLATASAASAAA